MAAEIVARARQPIENFYEIGKVLGQGKFSTVFYSKYKATGKPYAIKKIDKHDEEFNIDMLTTEVTILKSVTHPNIISLEEVFDSKDTFSMVMEYVSGGELFDRIVDRGCYSEKDAASIMQQILSAVRHLHRHNIVHRDLKPENLLCSDDSEVVVVKIADFGLSKILREDVLLSTACGTPGYVAPEVLLQNQTGYTSEVDLWSVGVIMYILLCGFPPFYEEAMTDLFQQILEGRYDYPAPYWDNISSAAKDLIDKLLVVDPKGRLTCDEALEHPWIKGTAPTENMEHFKSSMLTFNARRRLKGAVHAVIAINKARSMSGTGPSALEAGRGAR